MKRRWVCFLISCSIYFFAIYYVHMDCVDFWNNTYEYLSSLSFPYMFIVSTELSLLYMAIPVATGLSICNNDFPKVSKFKDVELICRRNLLSALTPLLFCFTIFVTSSIVIMGYNGASPWLTHAHDHAYQWRATNKWMWLYVVECIGRLCISTAFWCFLGMAIKTLFPKINKICLVTVLFLLCCSLGRILFSLNIAQYDLMYVQIPPVCNSEPLSKLLLVQLVYLASSIIFFLLALITKQKRKDAIIVSKPLWKEFIIVCVASSLILIWRKSILGSSNNNAFLDVFGGVAWGTPEISIRDVVQYIVLFIPLNFLIDCMWDKRYEEKRWLLKCCGLTFLLLLFMFCFVGIQSLFLQLEYMKLVDRIPSVLYTMLLFSLYSFAMVMINILIKSLTNSSLLSNCATLIFPFMEILICSNEDHLENVRKITSLGMIKRSSLFSDNYVVDYYPDGSSKVFEICSFEYKHACVILCIIVLILLFINLILEGKTLHHIFSQYSNCNEVNTTK